MIVFGSQIGATAPYLLFVWLGSAAGAAWLAERKGYGERLGLAFGLLLSALGLLLALLLPGRPQSDWKREGPIPPATRHLVRSLVWSPWRRLRGRKSS
jgi:hypothetical protein